MCGRRIDYNIISMEYLKSWFRGFEQGIADLQPQQREVLFRACAVNCVHGGPFGLYRSLFEAAEGDLDRFFVKNRRTGRRSRRNRVCGTGVQPLFRGLFLCPAPCGVREYADVVRMFAAKRALRDVRTLAGSEIRGGSPCVDPSGRGRVRAEYHGRITDWCAVPGGCRETVMPDDALADAALDAES